MMPREKAAASPSSKSFWETASGGAALDCRGAGGASLGNSSAVQAGAQGMWLAVLCPTDTAVVEITLQGEQAGGAEFGGLRVWRVPMR